MSSSRHNRHRDNSVFALPIGIAAMIAGNVMQLPEAQRSAALMASLHAHPPLYATSIIFGSAGIYGLVKGIPGESIALTLFLMRVSAGLGALGGYLQLQRRSRRMNAAIG